VYNTLVKERQKNLKVLCFQLPSVYINLSSKNVVELRKDFNAALPFLLKFYKIVCT